MGEILKTNVCCFDLSKDCIMYLQSLGLNVYDGSLGSIFSIKWNSRSYGYISVLHDTDYPLNLQEYHVFIHDMGSASKKEYHGADHVIQGVENPRERYLVCSYPINNFDLRPYGSYRIRGKLSKFSNHRRIEVIFTEAENTVEYTSNCVGYNDLRTEGTFSYYDSWNILRGHDRYGKRVECEENWVSRVLFEGRLSSIVYYRTYILPTGKQGDKRVFDKSYLPLLKNESGDCVAYCYADNSDYVQFVLPQVEDKAGLLKKLFEEVLFPLFSDYFPDIEARRWIHNSAYLLPEERQIQETISRKQEEYKKEIEDLEKQALAIGEKFSYLKQLITESGSKLVNAVKAYLEWLGFENVVDKDETVKEGGIKEEDLCFEYKGIFVLVEVKGINGTSTDSECSQIDKIVNRRMRALKTTDVHGVYVVNHQKNIEPIKRQVPPFNDTQIKDAEYQSRTLMFTAQLFSLYSDIENGYITREEAREDFLQSGMANFRKKFTSLGIPYDYHQQDTVICLDLDGSIVSNGDTLFYKDTLGRLVAVEVESIQQENNTLKSASQGKTGIKVSQKFPRNREVFICLLK